MPGYREFRPSPDISRYIECYWSRTIETSIPSLILPDGCVDILFSTSQGLEVVGLMTRARPAAEPMGTRYFGLRFHPAMSAAFVPEAPELINRVVRLDGLWTPARVRRLEDRMACALTPYEAIRAIEAEIPAPRPLKLAGASERHHRRLYAGAAGVPPKYMQRLLRFRAASQRILTLREAPAWADFALAHGYYDQAHFIREFQEFAGLPPGRFLQSLRDPA